MNIRVSLRPISITEKKDEEIFLQYCNQEAMEVHVAPCIISYGLFTLPSLSPCTVDDLHPDFFQHSFTLELFFLLSSLVALPSRPLCISPKKLYPCLAYRCENSGNQLIPVRTISMFYKPEVRKQGKGLQLYLASNTAGNDLLMISLLS